MPKSALLLGVFLGGLAWPVLADPQTVGAEKIPAFLQRMAVLYPDRRPIGIPGERRPVMVRGGFPLPCG